MGRNVVKSVTAIHMPLLGRVRALRHEFTMVSTGIRAVSLVTASSTSSFSTMSLTADSTAVPSIGYLSSGSGDSRFHEFFQLRVVNYRLHRHTCTASEFTPVTRIYSNPSWDQYLTVGMRRIYRGLTSPLYPGWWVPPRRQPIRHGTWQ
ncbi:hypothetical protein PIB30_052231 [Stylosanthes scabra]|uniref:Uncharacterized protein n=1 Tax=Stylosanthes scabra TaxID=79078 RepID=A0ABU6RI48_9FABA|nr:hypothetical protein [Stylosanthes scabra]